MAVIFLRLRCAGGASGMSLPPAVQAAGVEPASRRCGDLAKQPFVIPVLQHFVFLAVETHLREGSGIGRGPHAEQTLVAADHQASPIMPGCHLADFQGRLESVRAESEYVGDGGRLLHVARKTVVHHQLIGSAVEIRGRLALSCVRQVEKYCAAMDLRKAVKSVLTVAPALLRAIQSVPR